MLFRKRERFERTDVPTPGPYTNVIGGVVLAVVAVALFLIVNKVADRVALETRLGDSDLSKQVSAQSSMSVTDENYSISKNSFTKVLFLTVADADDPSTPTTITGARILVLEGESIEDENGTAMTVTKESVVNVPLETKVGSGEVASTLSDYCATQGAAACVVPLNAASNIKFSHVVVASEDVFDQVMALAGTDASKFIDEDTALLKKLRTDMTAEELIALANSAATVSEENHQAFDAPLYAETAQAEDGSTAETGYQCIDRTWLCIAVRTLVQ